MVAQPHSRYLLCESGIDSVLAWIDAKDLLQLVLKENTPTLHENLRRLAGDNLLIVPDTLSLSELLDRFRETREDFAVILNEYALVVGIITLYDVMSQLVEGIVSDDVQGLIVVRDANSWLVDGMTPVEDLKKVLEIESFPGEEGYETIAGFLMHALKRIPRRAEFIEYEGYKFEVLDIDHYKIDQVLVSRI
jgi:CBS domain containing-hemolysin-like protein